MWMYTGACFARQRDEVFTGSVREQRKISEVYRVQEDFQQRPRRVLIFRKRNDSVRFHISM